jgi:hypothetical protein
MRIWADLSAPAHVLVLRPIIERLRERAMVQALLDLFPRVGHVGHVPGAALLSPC